jgi:hypothetical protein
VTTPVSYTVEMLPCLGQFRPTWSQNIVDDISHQSLHKVLPGQLLTLRPGEGIAVKGGAVEVQGDVAAQVTFVIEEDRSAVP